MEFGSGVPRHLPVMDAIRFHQQQYVASRRHIERQIVATRIRHNSREDTEHGDVFKLAKLDIFARQGKAIGFEIEFVPEQECF